MKHLVSLCCLLFCMFNSSIAQYAEPNSKGNNTGNVGIGTTTPTEKLEVTGNIKAMQNLIAIGRKVYFGNIQRLIGNNTSALTYVSNDDEITQLIFQDKDGSTHGRIYGDDNGSFFGLLDGDINWSLQIAKDNYTAFLIDNAEKMRITVGGDVGIGTSSPSDKLHLVGGDFRLSNNREILFEDIGQIRSRNDNHRILFRTSQNILELREEGDILFSAGATQGVETKSMIIDAAGKVGIGQPTPANTLHIKPANIADDPIRIQDLNYHTPSDTSILVIDENSGVIRYINPFDLTNLLGQDGTGTDDQTVDQFSLSGTTLSLSLEDDGQTPKTVSLAGFNGDITDVTAGNGLTGGGATGSVTIHVAAENGLNVNTTLDRVHLGGALNRHTSILNGAYNLTHNLNSTGNFLIQDAGTTRFAVLNNGRTTVGETASAGMFNVTGQSFFSNDLYLRDGTVTGANLVRIFDSSDDGVIDVYRAGVVTSRIHGNGNSYITGGNFGVGLSVPVEKIHTNGNIRFDGRIAYFGPDEYINGASDELGFFLNNIKRFTMNGYAFESNAPNNNTWLGRGSGHLATTGNDNTAIGVASGVDITTGYDNTFAGFLAGANVSTGFKNTCIGYESGSVMVGTQYNTLVGDNSGSGITTGSHNVCVGGQAGNTLSTGIGNTLIGRRARADANSNYSTAIGYFSTTSGNHTIRLGYNNTASIGGYQEWSNLSDGRFKANVKTNVPGLAFINRLKPVTYTLKVEELNDFMNVSFTDKLLLEASQEAEQVIRTGFIAQEVAQAAYELGFDFNGVDQPQNETDHYSLRYATFVVPLVKAVQEQQDIIDQQNEKIQTLESANERIEADNKKILSELEAIRLLIEQQSPGSK